MRVRTLTFGAGDKKFLGNGIFFIVIDTSADIDITFKGDAGVELYKAEGVQEGFSVNFAQMAQILERPELRFGFRSVEIESASAQTIKYGMARDIAGTYNRFSGVVDISIASGIQSTADVTLTAATATSIIAANTARKKVYITNLGTNEIRLGDSNITATRGIPVASGETVALDTTAQIYGFNTAAEDVAVLEIT